MPHYPRLARWALPVALIGCAGIFLANSACGILGVGVALPQAVASNSNYSIKGDLVDGQGVPLEDVLIHIDHSHVYWDAVMGTATKDESKTVQANKAFEFGWIRGNHVELEFSKNGYASQRIEMIEGGYSQHTSAGNIWPKDQRVKVTLFKNDMAVAQLSRRQATVSYADYPQQNAISLNDAGGGLLAAEMLLSKDSFPPNCLYAVVSQQPTPTTGADHRVEPLDIGLPAHVALKISAADGGFVRFIPVPGTSPLEQMAVAPTAGYAPAFEIDGKRLRQMREKGNDYILEGHEFFYFRVNGKYGKGVVSWGRPENQPECQLNFGLFLQPDGTGNLASADGTH